jgi:periplasmic protein CpxP/Spy
MRKTIGTLALTGLLTLGLAASAAWAQDNGAPPPQQGQWGHGGPHRMDPDRQLKHLTKELDLTADQQTQIKPILAARDQQAQQLFSDQSMAPQDRHSKMKAIQEDSNAKIEAVLNGTQKQKFEQMQAEMEAHRHGGPGAGEAAPAPQQ